MFRIIIYFVKIINILYETYERYKNVRNLSLRSFVNLFLGSRNHTSKKTTSSQPFNSTRRDIKSVFEFPFAKNARIYQISKIAAILSNSNSCQFLSLNLEMHTLKQRFPTWGK